MKLYKMILPALCIAGVNVLPSVAYADYQDAVSYSRESIDYDSGTDGVYEELAYTHYFKLVRSKDQPLAEAAFLQRVSSIEFSLFAFDFDFTGSVKADGDGSGFALDYYNPGSPLKLGIAYRTYTANYSVSGFPYYDLDVTEQGISLGWFLERTLLLDIQVIKEHVEFSPYSSSNYDTTDTYIVIKNVRELGGGKFVNLEGLIGKNDHDDGTNNVYGVLLDYYLTTRLGIGGTYVIESGDDETQEGRNTAIHLQAFINKNISLGVEMQKFDADNAAGDSYDEIDLELKVRF